MALAGALRSTHSTQQSRPLRERLDGSPWKCTSLPHQNSDQRHTATLGEWRARVTSKVWKDADCLRSPLSSPVGPLQQQKLLGQGQWIVINVIRQVMPMAAAISHALFSQRQNGTAPGFRNPNIELAFFFTMPVWKGHQPPGTVTSRDKSSQPWQAHISALSCQAGPHPRWARRVQGGHACPLAKPGPLPVSVRP